MPLGLPPPEPFRLASDAIREAYRRALDEWLFELAGGPADYPPDYAWATPLPLCEKVEAVVEEVLKASPLEGAGAAEIAFAAFYEAQCKGFRYS